MYMCRSHAHTKRHHQRSHRNTYTNAHINTHTHTHNEQITRTQSAITKVVTGTLTFRLLAKATFMSGTQVDEIPASLCWRLGKYAYRETRTYSDTVKPTITSPNALITRVSTSYVESYTPSDYIVPGHPYYNYGSPARPKALPMFMSGSAISLTVYGYNFGAGSSGVSPLRVRPIPMPFAMDDETATNCILSETTVASRVASCKEYRSLIEYPDGLAHQVGSLFMYACIYVCVYVCMYEYSDMLAHQVGSLSCMPAYMYVCMYVCMYV
jgi:hypothetical protein